MAKMQDIVSNAYVREDKAGVSVCSKDSTGKVHIIAEFDVESLGRERALQWASLLVEEARQTDLPNTGGRPPARWHYDVDSIRELTEQSRDVIYKNKHRGVLEPMKLESVVKYVAEYGNLELQKEMMALMMRTRVQRGQPARLASAKKKQKGA